MTEENEDMINATNKEDVGVTGNVPLWVALVCSLFYLGLLYWLFTQTNACGPLFPEYGDSISRWDWITQQLACLSSNELGDMLAGAFAPLAFLWFVATVLIQTFELRAQRAELGLTRAEMASSTALLKAQTEVIQDEGQRRKQRDVDQDFESVINLMHDRAKGLVLSIWAKWDLTKNPKQEHISWEKVHAPLQPPPEELGKSTFVISLQYAIQGHFEVSVMKREDGEFMDWYATELERLEIDLLHYKSLIKRAGKLYKKVSSPLSIAYETTDFKFLAQLVQEEIDMLPKLPTFDKRENRNEEGEE